MAANIQAYLENLQQPWGQIYYDILFDQLQDIKGKRVLDFGSGFGLVAKHLAQKIKSLLWSLMKKWWPCVPKITPTNN